MSDVPECNGVEDGKHMHCAACLQPFPPDDDGEDFCEVCLTLSHFERTALVHLRAIATAVISISDAVDQVKVVTSEIGEVVPRSGMSH